MMASMPSPEARRVRQPSDERERNAAKGRVLSLSIRNLKVGAVGAILKIVDAYISIRPSQQPTALQD